MTKSDLLPGLLPGMVFLTDPAPGWARLYDQEAARIAKALGPVVVAIEHYGSTSVSGAICAWRAALCAASSLTMKPPPTE